MPFFSVIVPVYQAEKYIKRLIESIICQDFSDYELLLVDDGSTDKSGKICDEYASKNERIRVLHQKNGGVSAARNRGLEIAKGKYVIFADADDWYSFGAFSRLAEICNIYLADLVVYGHILDNTKIQVEIHPPFLGVKTMKELSGREEFEKYLYGDSANSVWTKVYERSRIREYGLRFPSRKIGEDAIFAFQYLSKCSNVYFLNECLYHYYQNECSTVHTYCNTRWNDELILIDVIENLMSDWGYSKETSSGLISKCYRKAILFELYNLLSPGCPMTFKEKAADLKEKLNQYEYNCMWDRSLGEQNETLLKIQIILLRKKWCKLLIAVMTLKRSLLRI